MNNFFLNREGEAVTEEFPFGDFIKTAASDRFSDSLYNLQSSEIQKIIRVGLYLVAGITFIFIPITYGLFKSPTTLYLGLFLFPMWIAASACNHFKKMVAFSNILGISILGCTIILALMTHDSGGFFIAGLSIFLLAAQFLLSPKMYYWSLLPILAVILFLVLEGPRYLWGTPFDNQGQYTLAAYSLLWFFIFVLVTQVIRSSYFTTLAKVIFLNKELEKTKASLLEANESLDELNKSLEDRIFQRTQDLQASLVKAQSISEAKNRFFATMSHELRTPLNAIIGYSEIITEIVEDINGAEEDDLEEIDHSAKSALSAGKDLLSIIDNVLEISWIESAKTNLEISQLDLNTLKEDLRQLVAPVIKKNHNQFVISDTTAASAVETDEFRIRRILINLLENAAKFTHNGVVELKISDAANNLIEFQVKDTGVGISESKLEMVFEPFMQAEEANMYSRQYGGVGLGLAICKQLSIELGGDLSVESHLGQGTCFTLRIPKTTSA
ncbi:MAG: ATP-binding protein [Chloroflexota bacterium]